MNLVVAVVLLIGLLPPLSWTAEPPTVSADRDLLIRRDQRQQQLDRDVQGLKGDLLRALDQQQKTLESGQQAVRTQIESLDTQSTLLWSLLVWATGLVGTAFGLLWYWLGKIEDRLTALADRLLPPPSPGGQGSSGDAPAPPPAPAPAPSQPSGSVPEAGLGRTRRAIRLEDERT